MSELDDIRASIYDWIKDQSQQLENIRNEAVTHRQTVNAAVNFLSNELAGFGKQLESFITMNATAREKRQQWQDYKDLAIGCLMVLTLLLGCSIISLLLYVIYSRGASI